MKTFRKAVLRVFIRKARIIRDRQPSTSQRLENERFMQNFIDTKTTKDKVAAAAICGVLPGDWSDTSCVQLFPKENESDARHIKNTSKRFSKAALSCSPTSFPSSKWQKTRQSVDFLGRLTPHAILEDGFVEMCSMLKSKDQGVAGRGVVEGALALEDGAGPANAADGADQGAEGGAGAAADVKAVPMPGSAVADAVAAAREEQARFRSQTLDMLHQLKHDGVVSELLSFNKILAIHVRLMEDSFWRAGERYDARQEANEIKELVRRKAGKISDQPPRKYRLQEAYEGAFEQRVLDTVWSLMDQDWQDIPLSSRTQANQSKVFKTLARTAAGARHEQRAHENYPFKLLASPWHQSLERFSSICVARVGWIPGRAASSRTTKICQTQRP